MIFGARFCLQMREMNGEPSDFCFSGGFLVDLQMREMTGQKKKKSYSNSRIDFVFFFFK